MFITLGCLSVLFLLYGKKKLKLTSEGGGSGSKKCKRGCTEGLVETAFGRNLASVALKMFSYLIFLIKTFYKFCTFSAISKDNAAINCSIRSIFNAKNN
jgi:hypothetical protein